MLAADYRLKILYISKFFFSCNSNLLIINASSFAFYSIGCATSAPDGSSPRGYGRVLVADHRLKCFLTPEDLLDSSLLFSSTRGFFSTAHDVIADDDGVFECVRSDADLTHHKWAPVTA
jgi:hypothetical protein